MDVSNQVSVLLKINFSQLSLEDKLKIKEVGRPLPDLNLTQEKRKIGFLCDVFQDLRM